MSLLAYGSKALNYTSVPPGMVSAGQCTTGEGLTRSET